MCKIEKIIVKLLSKMDTMTKFLVYTLCLRKIDQIIHIHSFFPTVMTSIWARNIFHIGNLLGAIMMIKISVKEMM